MEIVIEAIVRFIKEQKRLVIPGLGAFIRKGSDGEVVFVEFLKKDDGVLEYILAAEYGLSRQEAISAMDKFISDVNAKASSPGGFAIPGLGVLRMNADKIIDLEYNPGKTASSQLPQEAYTKPAAPPAPAAERLAAAMQNPVAPGRKSILDQVNIPGKGKEDTPVRATQEPVKVSASPEFATDVPLKTEFVMKGKGMQYQKPARELPDKRKKKADVILFVAIIAAAIAIIAMVYGMLSERDMQQREPEPATEQAITPTI